ncbi:MAG: GNAT family N-acetyltransferase [Actinomycetota bacterium]|nr:GNAT family N-acetyltransferase [Actinomycetota bacterium]
MDVTIRLAQADEAEVLFEIQKAASLAGLGHIVPADRFPYPDEAVRDRWLAVVVGLDHQALVAEADGAAMGVAAVEGDWMNGLYVRPERWGSRVAPGLHDAALDLIRGSGAASAHLWVLEANTRARRFYERRGWRENGATRVVPYPPQPLDVGYSREL